MAKKAKTSARSKGYRKTVQKKPFLTKKEIIALVAIVAVIALAILLFNLLYDDGSLDVVDGVVQTENFETASSCRIISAMRPSTSRSPRSANSRATRASARKTPPTPTSPPLSIRQKTRPLPSTTSASPAVPTRRMN